MQKETFFVSSHSIPCLNMHHLSNTFDRDIYIGYSQHKPAKVRMHNEMEL